MNIWLGDHNKNEISKRVNHNCSEQEPWGGKKVSAEHLEISINFHLANFNTKIEITKC